jgi:hypothetical protein
VPHHAAALAAGNAIVSSIGHESTSCVVLPSELESWVLSASPGSVRLGQGCYADSPEFTGSSAVMEEVASRLTLSADEVGGRGTWGTADCGGQQRVAQQTGWRCGPLTDSCCGCMHLLLVQVREKKRWGRLLKAKGDLCLLAGSHQDAYEHYR